MTCFSRVCTPANKNIVWSKGNVLVQLDMISPLCFYTSQLIVYQLYLFVCYKTDKDLTVGVSCFFKYLSLM